MKKNFIPVVKHFCFKCDSKLVKEKELNYPFYCPKCEENMFTFEARIIKYKKFKRKFKNSLKEQD